MLLAVLTKTEMGIRITEIVFQSNQPSGMTRTAMDLEIISMDLEAMPVLIGMENQIEMEHSVASIMILMVGQILKMYFHDSSQWSDWDGDGFGDELIGYEGDACPSQLGNSTNDRYGCVG